MTTPNFHQSYGAVLAADGIPLHYGDQPGEFTAAPDHAVLMDRSHEGRIRLDGKDRLAFVQRMSTNDVASLREGEGKPTIFTSPIGRILDRVMLFHQGDHALMLSEPGRGDAVRGYLQRNIFFNDDVRLTDLSPTTRQFVLAGKTADDIIAMFAPNLVNAEKYANRAVEIAGASVMIGRVKPLIEDGGQWSLLVPSEAAEMVWNSLLDAGKDTGLRPAGSLTVNALRIRAGRPGVGRELSSDYIPLEVGLWDEVSFNKGCYTGQEIIARMESRGRLAKTIVALELDSFVEAPAPLMLDGREVGRLTSSVAAPNGNIYGIGIVKVPAAVPETHLQVGSIHARIVRLAGVQPQLQPEPL
jgi:aminomethyltransferase